MQCVKNNTVIVLARLKYANDANSEFYIEKKVKLTRQLAHFVGVCREVHQKAHVLEQKEREMNIRVDLAKQHRTGDVFEYEVTEALHQPNVR